MSIDFFLSGFGRCGSTSLHRILRQHRDIFLPIAKDQSTMIEEGWKAFQYDLPYHYFLARGEKVRGYSSVLFSGNEAQSLVPLLASSYPKSKFLFIVRDPLMRIESEFRNLHTTGARYGIRCPFDFSRAIREIDTIIADTAYYSRIGLFRQHFSEQQIKVVFLEDLVHHRRFFLNEVCEFLGVAPYNPDKTPEVHENDSRFKYYDCSYLRQLRDDQRYPRVAEALNLLSHRTTDQFLPQIGQRLLFGSQPIAWKNSDYEYVMEHLYDDAVQLLAYMSRSIEVWPRFQEASTRNSTQAT